MLSATIKTPSNRDMHKMPLRRSGGLSLKQNKQTKKIIRQYRMLEDNCEVCMWL